MDDKIRDKIVEAVHADFGWKKEEVRVDEVDRLRRDGCSFFTAGHTVRPLAYQPNYAILPGVTLLRAGEEKAVTKIVDACGGDASAGWWAEIITRFHSDLGSGVVLHDENQNAAAVRKVKAAGKEFAPPALSGDAGGKMVTFYLLDPESFVVYSVKAARKADGTITVEKTELLVRADAPK